MLFTYGGIKMNYCSNCGAPVNENAYVCLNCGFLLKKEEEQIQKDGKTLGIVGLFVWLVPLAGWIVSGIGLSQAKKADNESAKTMNIIGLVLSTAMFVISLITQLA